MKTKFLSIAAVAAAALALSSCNNQQPQVEEKSASQAAPTELKIAYVEYDSLMTKYQFVKDFSEIIQKKSRNVQSTLEQKRQAIENAGANFEKRLRENSISSQEEAERIQAAIAKQQNDFVALQNRLGNELTNESNKYSEALGDSVRNFIKAYNKNKKYTFIFTKAGDNMLYADKAYDITDEVIAGLNKAYKGMKEADKKADEKKEEKKK